MSTPFQKYIVISLGYQDLVGIYGVQAIPRIEAEIKEYNLLAMLEVCSKVSLKLLNRGTTNPLGQAELLSGLFNDKDMRLKFYEKARAASKGNPWAIFHMQSVLTLTKLAIKNCKRSGGKSITAKEIDKVGYWLLMLNDDLFSSESRSDIKLPKLQERERLRAALARYQFFNSSERLGYKIGRYRWIVDYFRNNRPHGIDIDSLFREASKLSLKAYMAICASLLVKWTNISTREVDITKEWVTCKKVYFKDTKLTEADINDVLSFIAMTPDEFDSLYNESIKEILSGEENLHYNFLPFVWKPLVWDNEKQCFVCPSAEYLFDKVTEGIYRTIETFLRRQGKQRKKDRNTFSIAWGKSLEAYVNDCLTHAFKKRYSHNLIDKVSGDEMLDGLIETPNFLFMIETKSMNWSFKAMVTGNRDAMQQSLKQLFMEKGLAQLARCITKVRNKEWELPNNIDSKQIIPILVVSNYMPLDAYNRKLYEETANKSGNFIIDTQVLPFIILTIEEIEIVEALTSQRGVEEVLQILAEYSYLYTGHNEEGYVPEAISFKNYLFHRGYENPESVTKNTRLLKYFDDVMDDVSLLAFGRKTLKRRNSNK